jgi:hypothetical protein
MTGLTRRGLLEAGGSAALAAGISGEAKAVSVGAPGSAPERFPGVAASTGSASRIWAMAPSSIPFWRATIPIRPF